MQCAISEAEEHGRSGARPVQQRRRTASVAFSSATLGASGFSGERKDSRGSSAGDSSGEEDADEEGNGGDGSVRARLPG